MAFLFLVATQALFVLFIHLFQAQKPVADGIRAFAQISGHGLYHPAALGQRFQA